MTASTGLTASGHYPEGVSMATTPGQLELHGIHKSFGGVAALRGVDLSVRAGKVHALLGMNGAGKSTLVQIACGALVPGKGDIKLGGTHTGKLTPRRARALGIATVHQRRTLVPTLTVGENLSLGRLSRQLGIVRWNRVRTAAGIALKDIGVDIDPNTLVGDLGAGQQTLVEIAREVSAGGKVLILDEPTASLGGPDVAAVHAVVRNVTERGIAVVYISHHLDEVMEIADEVTVLRDGKVALHDEVRALGMIDLVRAMVGANVEVSRPPRPTRDYSAVLTLEGIADSRRLSNLDLTVGGGEIVAVLGPAGDGQESLFPLLSGLERPAHGTVSVKGKSVRPGDPRDALRLGLRCVSGDRLGLGLVPGLSIDENITSLDSKLNRGFFVAWRKMRLNAAELRSRYNVATLHRDPAVESLSGGNQQKVLLGKWLAGENIQACFLEEPTGGVDISAKQEIHKLVEDMAASGAAVLLASTDVDEVLRLADRIIVVRNGRPVAELPVEGTSRDELVSIILGGSL